MRRSAFVFNSQKGKDALITRMNNKRKTEGDYFLNEQNQITYNELCLQCQKDCKQSFRCKVIYCPKYVKKKRKTKT